ncbi:MAG: methyltransferase [Frankia sp.]|nr:methyltransferase [Frankia sp.]
MPHIVSEEKLDVVRRIETLAAGAGLAAVLQAAIRLEIPDKFDEGSVTADELAKTVQAEPAALNRLMRALTVHGVFDEVEPGRYTHNELSRWLRDDSEIPIKHLVLWMGAPWTWQAWPRLADAVRTGQSVIPDIYGKDFYTYLGENLGELEQFSKAMTAITMLSAAPVTAGFDLSDVGVVADIAGGQGRLLRELLERWPHVKGVLFDLPAVVETAEPALRPGGALADRVTLVGGDLYDEVPVEADLYILKNILDAPNAEQALINIRESAKPGARVVIVDAMMDAPVDELRVTTIVDLFLLLNVGGARNTRREFELFYERAGLKFTGMKKVPGTFPAQYFWEAVVPER